MNNGKKANVMNIAIVGAAGAFGRWFTAFFQREMSARILAHDPALASNVSVEQIVREADVLLFCTPTRHSAAIIEQFAQASKMVAREQPALWLDITSIKTAPIQAMTQSDAEVVGLHPMCAAPSAPTMRGKVLIVCRERLHHWQSWFEQFLEKLQAEILELPAERHDPLMAQIQGVVHASAIAQALQIGTLPESAEQLWALRSPAYALSQASIGRILRSNAAIYQDIQFDNAYVQDALRHYIAQLQHLTDLLEQGDETARQQWRQQFDLAAEKLGANYCEQQHQQFEQLSCLLSDLAEPEDLILHLHSDRPGALRELLQLFEQQQLNLRSIHSARQLDGRVLFRIGLEQARNSAAVQSALQQIQQQDLATLVPASKSAPAQS